MKLDELRELLRLLEEREIAEFEIEEENLKLRIRRSAGGVAQVVIPASAAPVAPSQAQGALAAPAASVPSSAAETAALAEEEAGLHVVKSPIVGTFYGSPDPTSAPFVSVGDKVRVGQVLCIIEAMKLMNEIESEAKGRVVRILVENAQPVEYGQKLFLIEP